MAVVVTLSPLPCPSVPFVASPYSPCPPGHRAVRLHWSLGPYLVYTPPFARSFAWLSVLRSSRSVSSLDRSVGWSHARHLKYVCISPPHPAATFARSVSILSPFLSISICTHVHL